MFQLCDAHLHLTRADLPRLETWRAAGLAGAVSATAHCSDWPEALELMKQTPPWVHFALGVHPWHLAEAPEDALAELDALLGSRPALAVGEIGLDFADGRDDRERQLHWFEAQLALAARHHRTAVLHLRRAWDLAPAILAKYPHIHIVLHSFNGSREIARQLLATHPNCYFSFGFALANLRATRQASAAQVIPAERLLTDSDYPYQQLPASAESSPADLAAVIARLAELSHVPPNRLAVQLAENWTRAFSAVDIVHESSSAQS